MLPLDTIQGIRSLLKSDRIAYKGNEIDALAKVLRDLDAEEETIHKTTAARIKPVAVKQPDYLAKE